MLNLLSTLAEILSGCVMKELQEPEQGGGGRLAAIGSMYIVQTARSYWWNRLERV